MKCARAVPVLGTQTYRCFGKVSLGALPKCLKQPYLYTEMELLEFEGTRVTSIQLFSHDKRVYSP